MLKKLAQSFVEMMVAMVLISEAMLWMVGSFNVTDYWMNKADLMVESEPAVGLLLEVLQAYKVDNYVVDFTSNYHTANGSLNDNSGGTSADPNPYQVHRF